MTPDVQIRRCTLTVRRRGGWAWPTDPTDYLQAAMDAVERALTDALTDSGLPDDTDMYVREPVRLVIGRDGRPSWSNDAPLAHLLRAIRADATSVQSPGSTEDARPPDPGTPTATNRPTTTGRDMDAPTPIGEIPAPVSARGLTRTLEQWSRSGRLETILARWPEQTVRRWLSLIYRVSRSLGPDSAEMTVDAVRRIAATLGIYAADNPADPTEKRVDLLRLVTAIVGAVGGRLPGPVTLHEAAEACATTWPTYPVPVASAEDIGSVGSAASYPQPRGQATDSVRSRATPPMPVAMVPALPFLALVQLVRIGYASAMVAAAGGRTQILQALAAGIAGKVLPPPARGWRREPAEDTAVTAASGLDPAALSRAALAARSDEPQLARPLRDALVSLCADGRARTEPIELTECPQGIICGDRVAGLPLAWVATRRELADVLSTLGDPPVHRSAQFSGFAADLAARRAFPGVELPELERALGAAAGAALGSLAYELWPDLADGVSPGLLIERFADLEARVETTDRLTIGIPRGRRWLDLHHHGLVDAWAVPWNATGLWELVTW